MKFSPPLASQTPLSLLSLLALCSASLCLLHAAESQGSIASRITNLWLHVVHSASRTMSGGGGNYYKDRHSNISWSPQAGMWSGLGKRLELRTRKASLFLPWMCLLNFSLSPDCSPSHGRMRLPKLQVLHVVGKPLSRNCFSGPIPNYLETGNLIHLGSSDWPWSNQLGTGEVEGREGVDKQHNHSSTPVLIEVMGQGEN